MKVLWFSNTPANADEYYNTELTSTGGWLKALDQALQKQVDLHIAFYGSEDRVFQYKGTKYCSLKRKDGVFSKLKSRYLGSIIDKEDLPKYLSIINEVKPDIIHIHGTENPFGCIIPHVTIPVVMSIQGNITVYHHKFLSGFEKRFLNTNNRRLTSWKSLLFPRSFRSSYKRFKKMQVREENNLKHVKYIMGRTYWDYLITRILAKNSKYFKDDRVLRDSFYKLTWQPIQRNKIIIHTTNSNNIYKGFETLCQALYELNNTGIKCEWRVAGVSDNDLIVKITKSKLKNKYPSFGLKLLGKLNEKKLGQSLLDSDIYVMTSHIENNVNSLCEAMILGMPCISTFVGGVGSLIKDREEGLLIQSGDPWVMAGAILELANDQQLAVRLGQNARKTALVRHDKERIVGDLIKNYKSIIESSSKKNYV